MVGPADQPPPSTRYCVAETPDPEPSLAESVTVTGAIEVVPGEADGPVTGAVLSTRTVIVAAAGGERSKTTVATPEPPSAESDVSVTAGPFRFTPFAGAVTEPVGAVLSTRTVIVPETKLLPARSVVVTRRS